jgi:hypothetical protein
MAQRTIVQTIFGKIARSLLSDSAGNLLINLEGQKSTYSALANSTTVPTFTAAAGDIALIPGAAGKLVTVTRVEVTLSTSGTAAIETVSLISRSSADSGGTSATMLTVPHDSFYAPAQSVPLLYTVAPTTSGTAVGFIRATQFNDQSASLPGAATWIWTFGDGRGGASGFRLRGTAQQLCVNLAGVVATQTAAVSFEWTEE